jgi:hypothetical protein
MDKKISHHLTHLKLFDNQRKSWLVLSLFVVAAIVGIIYDWDGINQYHLLWAIASIGCTISVSWWYWTMKIIRTLIQHRQEESEILNDVVKCIREVKEDIKKLPK